MKRPVKFNEKKVVAQCQRNVEGHSSFHGDPSSKGHQTRIIKQATLQHLTIMGCQIKEIKSKQK